MFYGPMYMKAVNSQCAHVGRNGRNSPRITIINYAF